MNGRNLLLWMSCLSPFRYTATKCGHSTKLTGEISAFGHTIVMQMPKNDNGQPDYCLECIAKMTVQCAWCGEPIFIGSSVTLYSPGPRDGLFISSNGKSEIQKNREKEDFLVPEGAVVYSENPLILVGCLRWNCADTGADRAGFLEPGEDGKGYVRRVPMPLELMLTAAQPSMLIVGDVSDPREAMHPRLFPLPGNESGE